ncbi:MAG: SRPBCC family protein [Pseudohongiellaceae bacterium]
MVKIELEQTLPYSVEAVWAVIGDVTRSDWVPSVNEISLLDGVRSFSMEGVGEVQERILVCDAVKHRLQYSAIKTPSGIEHHLATIQLSQEGDSCLFTWTTEIQPDEYAPVVEHGMNISLEGLKTVLAG